MTEQPEQGKTTSAFEAARYLTKVGGSDYLEVKWRLVWMRDQHPDAILRTELVEHNTELQLAVIKCTVILPNGAEATGYGSEHAGDFRDYLEKAETKAIGRALGALGFGTQFAPDHEFGAASGNVVDSPVNRRNPQAGTPRPAGQVRPNSSAAQRADPVEQDIGKTASVAATGPDQPATQRQLRYLQAVAREAGLDQVGLDGRSEQEFGVPAAALTRRDASSLIDIINSSK
jgi:hypothetical protein